MTDLFDRLAARALGLRPSVTPVVAPLFAATLNLREDDAGDREVGDEAPDGMPTRDARSTASSEVQPRPAALTSVDVDASPRTPSVNPAKPPESAVATDRSPRGEHDGDRPAVLPIVVEHGPVEDPSSSPADRPEKHADALRPPSVAALESVPAPPRSVGAARDAARPAKDRAVQLVVSRRAELEPAPSERRPQPASRSPRPTIEARPARPGPVPEADHDARSEPDRIDRRPMPPGRHVTVRIGRIDVRAVPAIPPAERPQPAPAAGPTLDLAEYLRSRGAGGR
jgi:hypothetical protein